MNKENIDEYEYAYHFCKLSEAKYVVLVIREIEYGYNNADEILSFKELKWAKKCYHHNQAGTGYPEILESKLIEIKEIKGEINEERNNNQWYRCK